MALERDGELKKCAYSISEVVAIAPLGRTKIYEEIAKGNLIARKAGRRTMILSDDLEQFLQKLPTVIMKKT